ncbi:MAG: trypsin-like peptidase domain-containing protein [Planctomycetota bacterium]
MPLFALLATILLAGQSWAQSAPPVEAPAEEPEAKPTPSPQLESPRAESPQTEAPQPEAEPAAAPPALQPEVPWDAEIERINKRRYPKSVGDLRRLQQQVQAVVQAARPAVVAVQLGNSAGSGVIVSEDGYVLTAGHVTAKPNLPVTFRFADGSRARGVSLGINRSIDSGLMKITDKGPWPHLKMAESNTLSPGDWVVGLGHPNGYVRDRAAPVRLGRVLMANDKVINTDVTLVGGDSGGPLINLKGDVVGIHSRIGRRITSNFHVPISTYEYTWERLVAAELWGGGIVTTEKARFRPLLGVTGTPRKKPCELVQVSPNTPADRAGLKQGDIVTRADDQDIESIADLVGHVLSKQPGAKIKLAIQRGDEKLEIEVQLARAALEFPGAPPMRPTPKS